MCKVNLAKEMPSVVGYILHSRGLSSMMDEFTKPEPIGDALKSPINVGGILVWR